MVPSHVGESESSKSAIKTFAPEFSALMIIFRSAGPVISTRRSCRSRGMGSIVHEPSRTCSVSGRKSGILPASISAWRCILFCKSSSRLPVNARTNVATKAIASGVNISANSGVIGPLISIPSGYPGCFVVGSIFVIDNLFLSASQVHRSTAILRRLKSLRNIAVDLCSILMKLFCFGRTHERNC